jgi:DNA-binding MarR family transcriptional regulator
MAKRPEIEEKPAGAQPLDQTELKQYPGYFLARARFMAFRAFHRHIGEAHALKPVEFSLLVLLGSNRDVTQKQLSQALGVAQPNMTGILRRLEERAILQRRRSTQDKRMQFITLTSAGTKLLRRALAAGKGIDKGWLGRLSAAEQGMLLELLEKVTIAEPSGE